MTQKEQQEMQEYIQTILKIRYENTPQEQIQTFESIETMEREEVLTKVTLKSRGFF
ncbi:MAG: hypothetical protein VKJ02_03630 [Snowella sp.]|nr:hypothetical protein [Snowella sp.]